MIPQLSTQKTKEDIIHEAQQEWIPGTVHLVDLENSYSVQHEGNTDIVLIPQPSKDPNDPLRWSKRKKNTQFIILWFWSFLSSAVMNWFGPAWDIWVGEFNTTYNVLNDTFAIGYAFLGIGCVLLQPTAMKLGRRGVYLVATICQTMGNVLGGKTNGIPDLYGVNILTCFAGAPVDSLVQISTTDVFFQHERADKISALTFAQFSGSYLGPFVAGYVIESMGWRWCYWFCTIFFGTLFAVQFFVMEDSTFSRTKTSSNTDTDILVQVLSKEENVDMLVDDDNNEKDNKITHDIELVDDEKIPKKRTYLQRMRFIETEYNDKRPWWKIALRPFLTLLLPAFLWGGFLYGIQFMWLALITTTQSLYFSSPPYNFSPSAVGLTNLSSAVGCFIGSFWGGQLSDKFVQYMARRNKGIMEPESRLWLLFFPAIINAGGTLMYGLGFYYGTHWVCPGVFGLGCMGFGMGAGSAIVITYGIDCYPEMQSEGLVLVLFIRNMVGMGFSFGLQPWIDTNGIKIVTWLMFMITIVANFSCIIFLIWGKNFRIKTKNFYLKYSDPNKMF